MSRPLLTLLALSLGLAAGTAAAQGKPPAGIPDDVWRQYQKLTKQKPPHESATQLGTQRADPLGLAIVLPQTRATIASALARAPTAMVGALQTAADAFALAEQKLHAASTSASPKFMVGVLQAMGQGQAALDQALDIAAAVDPQGILIGQLLPAVQKVREAAARSSQGLIDVAAAAGVSSGRLAPAIDAQRAGDTLHGRGEYGAAIGQYANGFGFAADTVVFNLDRFEQNLRSVFDNESVGWSYAITVGGQLKRSDKGGQARTGADLPAMDQSPTKKMHVASVSKTLTAMVLLRKMADLGLSVDSPIAPYLPATWTLGTGVDTMKFRHLLTHRSGFGQTPPGSNQYAPLKLMAEQDVLFKGDFAYDNRNFGLMRVIIAVMQGMDPAVFADLDPAALTASAFVTRAVWHYNQAGVTFSCDPHPIDPTLQYDFPDSGNPGYAEPPSALGCGGFGAFISATSLVRAMVYLRYTQDLLPAASFQQMKAGYLGLMNPADDFGFAQGKFGVYHGHGGDWDHPGWGGLDSCVYMFPIHVEAAVLVNSSRKAAGGSYSNGSHQCGVLKWAFENAWLAN